MTQIWLVLLADSYSDLEASILDEKEFLLLKVISTFPELSCLICSMVGVGRGIDGVALSMTHFSGRVTSSHFRESYSQSCHSSLRF